MILVKNKSVMHIIVLTYAECKKQVSSLDVWWLKNGHAC